MRQIRIIRDKLLISFALVAVAAVIGLLVWSQITAPSFGDRITMSGISANTEESLNAKDIVNINIHDSGVVKMDAPSNNAYGFEQAKNGSEINSEIFDPSETTTKTTGIPETGDDYMTWVLIAILVISTIGVVILTTFKRSQNQEEEPL